MKLPLSFNNYALLSIICIYEQAFESMWLNHGLYLGGGVGGFVIYNVLMMNCDFTHAHYSGLTKESQLLLKTSSVEMVLS